MAIFNSYVSLPEGNIGSPTFSTSLWDPMGFSPMPRWKSWCWAAENSSACSARWMICSSTGAQPRRDSQWHMATALGPKGYKASMMFDVRAPEKSFAVVPHDSLILMDIFFSRPFFIVFLGDHMITVFFWYHNPRFRSLTCMLRQQYLTDPRKLIADFYQVQTVLNLVICIMWPNFLPV